eukprot:SAG31_NODE_39978_length_284_cov_0.821622_1_plen_48_part_01
MLANVGVAFHDGVMGKLMNAKAIDGVVLRVLAITIPTIGENPSVHSKR